MCMWSVVTNIVFLWHVQKREREFDDFIQERLVQAKADLRELLKESKLITYKYRLYLFVLCCLRQVCF